MLNALNMKAFTFPNKQKNNKTLKNPLYNLQMLVLQLAQCPQGFIKGFG
jgi:hypothetical protein